ncbi:hypothetical protein D3C80_1147040 [compost metagenome]
MIQIRLGAVEISSRNPQIRPRSPNPRLLTGCLDRAIRRAFRLVIEAERSKFTNSGLERYCALGGVAFGFRRSPGRAIGRRRLIDAA